MQSLDSLYNQYQGQIIPASLVGGSSADNGQCFIWFDLVINRVYGQSFFHAPAAIDIWETPGVLLNNFSAIKYSPAMQIFAGDIVVYGTGVGSANGHVSIAAKNGVGNGYIGYDSNWGNSLRLQTIVHNDNFNSAILGILRYKGVNTMIPTVDLLNALFVAFLGRQSNTTEQAEFVNKISYNDLIPILNDNNAERDALVELIKSAENIQTLDAGTYKVL